jgi:hypothetical protein
MPVVVVMNKGSVQETVRIPLHGSFPGADALDDLVKGRTFQISAGAATVTLEPRTGAILVRRTPP